MYEGWQNKASVESYLTSKRALEEVYYCEKDARGVCDRATTVVSKTIGNMVFMQSVHTKIQESKAP